MGRAKTVTPKALEARNLCVSGFMKHQEMLTAHA